MEHGLKDIAFYVQKHITPCTVVITSLLVHEKPVGAPAYVKRVYWKPSGAFQKCWRAHKSGSALKYSLLNKTLIFQYMGKIFCAEFQRYPLKFRTKYLIHTLKDAIFIQCWIFKSSQIYELICVFEMPLQVPHTCSWWIWYVAKNISVISPWVYLCISTPPSSLTQGELLAGVH